MARSEFIVRIAALLLVGCASDPQTEPSQQLRDRLRDPVITSQLRVLTTGVSARGTAVAPATMRAVAATDHQTAESVISGADIGDHLPVFVVQATGGLFTADHSPPGVPRPTGAVLTVTYDAETLEIRDIGLDNLAPDLSRIDPEVIDLMPQAR